MTYHKHPDGTVRMIAYRAETAMTGLLKGGTVDLPAARRFLQDFYFTEADILPEPENKVLRIRIHGASRPAANRELEKLFESLNETGVCYPGTQLTLIYELWAKTGKAALSQVILPLKPNN